MNKNMITGSPAKSLIAFALPMILGTLFQQFYALADTIIVGNTLGQDALAAVGSTSTICMVYLSIANGLAIGCSVVISQLFGSGNQVRMKTAFNTAFIAFAGFSIIAMAIGLSTSGAVLSLTKIPESIMADSSSYYNIYVLGFPGLFFYNISNSGFNALGKSKMPLVFLAFSSALNIGLDFWFILGLKWGVAGAAIATIISQYLAAALSFIMLLRYIRKNFQTKEKPQLFQPTIFKTIMKVGVPSMITSSVISIGFVALQSLVNSFGTDVMAGYVAAVKVDNIAIVPMLQVANATSTFSAQNMGAGKIDRVSKGFRVGLVMNLVIYVVFAVTMFLFGSVFINAFMDSTASAHAIQVGTDYLKTVSLFYIVMGVMNLSCGVLRGVGDATFSMIATLANFASRVAFAYIMVSIFQTETMIWWSNLVGWGLGSIFAISRYLSGKWKNKSLVRAEDDG